MEEQAMAKFGELMNWWAFLVAALIPMIIGFIWYNPKTPMGAIWMKETEMTDEKMAGANMPLIFALSIFFSFLMSVMVISHEVIHQYGAASTLMKHHEEMLHILTDYQNEFRTFNHGVFHGAILGLCFVLPLFAINGMFERRSWKLIWVNVGFWTICLMLMGGVLCAWQ